ncbi:MAG: glycogen synthase [Acidimicrobiales bacterium]
MNVLVASAEMAPIARVGGMAEAVAGLVRQLRRDGLDVIVALPDYGGVALVDEQRWELPVPQWAGPVTARAGNLDGDGPIVLIESPGSVKPHPYNDESGQAFPDNDLRFFSFSAGIAALAEQIRPDMLHLNDWHTAATLGLLADPPPTVFTIHTLAYQGVSSPEWLHRLPRSPHLFEWYGATNPLLGAIQLADRVVAVSPNYAREIRTEAHGMGLHHQLSALGDRLEGVINGIDVEEWNPATDPHLAANFSPANIRGKAANRTALAQTFGLATDGPTQPIIGMVSRLVGQKGIDLAVDAGRFLEHLPARLAVLGSGDAAIVDSLYALAARFPDRVGFANGYDATLSHAVFAGSDLLLMPSRFEPCGLAQMQAMAYGTIPVVTDVGGLRDTVIDADVEPSLGTGFVSRSVDTAGMVDAMHRAVRAWKSTNRRAAIRSRGMATDWSWAGPAGRYREIYGSLAPEHEATGGENGFEGGIEESGDLDSGDPVHE